MFAGLLFFELVGGFPFVIVFGNMVQKNELQQPSRGKTDLGSSVAAAPKQQKAQPARGPKRTAEERGASQSSKAARMNVLSNAMDLVEETRENTVVGSPQASAPGTPAAPIVSENLVELITRAVATAMAPMRSLANRFYCDENLDEADGLGDI